MKKTLITLFAAMAMIACSKKDSKTVAPITTCDTSGIVGRYMKMSSHTGADYLKFDIAIFDTLGTDSFKLRFIDIGYPIDTIMPDWKSIGMPCGKMEYRNTFHNITDVTMYIYIDDRGILIDSIVNSVGNVAVLRYSKQS